MVTIQKLLRNEGFSASDSPCSNSIPACSCFVSTGRVCQTTSTNSNYYQRQHSWIRSSNSRHLPLSATAEVTGQLSCSGQPSAAVGLAFQPIDCFCRSPSKSMDILYVNDNECARLHEVLAVEHVLRLSKERGMILY